MFCFKCGKEVKEGARFCIYCGEDLSGYAQLMSTPEPKPEVPQKTAEPTQRRIEYEKKRSTTASQKTNTIDNILYIASLGCAVLAFVLSIFDIRGSDRGILPLIAALFLAALAFFSISYDSIPAAVPLVVLVIQDIRYVLYCRSYGVGFSISNNIMRFFLYAMTIWLFFIIVGIIREKRFKIFGQLGFLAGYLIFNLGFLFSFSKYGRYYFRIYFYGIAFSLTYILIIWRSESRFLKRIFHKFQTGGARLPDISSSSQKLREGVGYLSNAASRFTSDDISVSDEYSDGNYQKYPHPYHELGGWLKAIVVLGYITCGLYVLALLIIAIGTLQIIGQFGGLGMAFRYSGGSMVLFFAAIILGVFSIWLMFKFFHKIKIKDPSFLQYYHILSVVELVAVFLFEMTQSGFGSAIGSTLFNVLYIYLYTLYFCKSVRVRTYMGTDQYLRMSYFTRNVPSPIPADIKPYEGTD